MSAKSEDDSVPGVGGAQAPEERDPWAPPAEDRPAKDAERAPGAPLGPPPSVHDQWTVTSMPGAGSGPQPPAPPMAGGQPGVPPGVGNPFAAPGEPVPPPPVSPDGPGQMPYGPPGQVPYGYPGQNYQGYQAQGYQGQGYQGQPYQGYQGYQGYPGYGWPAMPMTPANGMGVSALVLGIIAAVGFCLWPLAIVLGILAVIFGAVGRGKARRGEATNGGQALAGIICGAAGIVLSVALLVILIVVPDEGSDDGSLRDGPGYSAAATTSVVGPRITPRT
ncbi:DUF4190 domain-containing protein [Streptomyces venezuelae]|uniref:DUF4190 domain-containing protein n=1 Tax=Streptomyces venezuelae TaxID=54571 RepID=UPI00365B4FD8